jgi:hypothetical protein
MTEMNFAGGSYDPFINLKVEGAEFHGVVTAIDDKRQARQFGTNLPLYWQTKRRVTEVTDSPVYEPALSIDVTKLTKVDNVEDKGVFVLGPSVMYAVRDAVGQSYDDQTPAWDGILKEGCRIKVRRLGETRDSNGHKRVNYVVRVGAPEAAKLDLNDPFATDVSSRADEIPF